MWGSATFFFKLSACTVRPHVLSVPKLCPTQNCVPNLSECYAIVACSVCSCGHRHVETRCVDMWRLQLSCLSHPVAIFECLLVHTARGSTVASFASGTFVQVFISCCSAAPAARKRRSRSRRTAESIASQQQLAQEAAALVTKLRGATIVGAAAESSSSTRGRQAADDSHSTRG